MKMSFSLSSLQPSGGGLERAEHARIRPADRPYNSLTKKRKEPMQEQCTKNWSGPEDNKDDFWAAIRTNYDYIMDTNLIDTCKEANGELAWDEGDVSTVSWGLKEVSCQFSELYSWLRVLQELVYSKEENLLDKNLRAAHTEELRRKAYRRRLFNEQAEKLIARAPSLKEEVSWRVDHLNAKWDLVEQIMAPVQRPDELDNQDVSADFEHEVKCLRKWLREMEDRLQPLNFRVDWTRTEIEEKAMEHMVLQKDIESHGRIVSSVVKLGERVKEPQAGRVASSLERRWHLLFLRALEWQCHIEALAARYSTKLSSSRCSSDSDDEEPVTKRRRASTSKSSTPSTSSSGSSQDESSNNGSSSSRCRVSSVRKARRKLRTSSRQSPVTFDLQIQDSSSRSDLSSDSDVSNRSADDGSYFEDDLDELCITIVKAPENSKHYPQSSTSRRRPREDQGSEADVEEEDQEEDQVMSPTPAMSIDEIDSSPKTVEVQPQSTPTKDSSPKRRKTEPEESAAFNTSNRKSKNCATFYFKHMDTDSEVSDSSGARQILLQPADESSEEEWTYASARSTADLQAKNSVKVRLNFDSDTDMKNEDESCTPEQDKQQVENNNLVSDDDEEGCTKDSIAKLIREVEKLVREEGTKGERHLLPSLLFDDKKGLLSSQNHRAKYARIKEWLALNRCHDSTTGRCNTQCCDNLTPESLDSCDASGEYTTGESDVEKLCDESEEDHQSSSVATCRRLNFSQSNSEELLEESPEQQLPLESSTPKVIMRTKRTTTGARPWSVSCITQIRKRASFDAEAVMKENIAQFSISETALNRLLVNGMPSKSASFDATTESRVPFNNSTSTLLEETTIGHDARVVRNSSLRRRKNRLRKKNVSRKSESSSDGLQTTIHRSENSDDLSSSCNVRNSARKSVSSRQTRSSRGNNALVKSGSFSGYSARQESERASASSDPPSRKINQKTSSESEDDEEERNERNIVNAVAEARRFNADSDIEKHSFGNTSFSTEQAWDNYQEKYMSEPYSETADVETARRLLDFGDDYRNFLDSQSDCASSLSAVHYKSNVTSEDSDSDSELKRLAETSRNQLVLSEASYMTMADHSFSELARVCRENIRCLRAMSDAAGVSRRRTDKYAKQIRGLMERWESLSLRAEEAQKISAIHREMASMKLEFCAAHERLTSYRVVLDEPHVIEDNINRITSELANLKDRKPAMLALNVSTHRLITDLGQKTSSPTCTALKDGVADLYRIWDEAFQKGNQQLCALQAVQQFGLRLSELQCALRRDKDTLAVLDAALKAGATMEVASSVRDVARLLSEKHEVKNQQNTSLMSDSTMTSDDSGNMTQSSFSDTLTSSLIGLEGGSLSDSGISDSGSEQELSERERRLAALRRLTRTLESQLVPGASDEVLAELWRRVEDAEAELRSLQAECRELIVRTAASVENRLKPCVAPPQVYPVPSKRKKVPAEHTPNPKARVLHKTATSPDDPDKEPQVSKSWVWRILRAALPFQLALVMLLCAACLLEPHCCEVSNSMNLSLTPQLRYVRGPPPV